MNHEHVTLQIHTGPLFVPGMIRAVSDGIDQWLQISGQRHLSEATIVLTDSTDFATKAFETNDIVVLITTTSHEVGRGIMLANPDTPAITRAVFQGCMQAFG